MKRLDLNHNFIRRIEGLDGKGALQNLNLTNNWISDINQIEHLRIHCPNLKELSLKCNPIAAKKSYRPTVFQRLLSTGLAKLDGIAMSDKDKERVRSDNTLLTRDLVIEALKSGSGGPNSSAGSLAAKEYAAKAEEGKEGSDLAETTASASGWEKTVE